MDIKKYKALYLFSGIGGGALGFQEVKGGYRILEIKISKQEIKQLRTN